MCSVAQSCLTLCNPMDCSPPGSSVHGILQARILEGVATPSSRGSSWPRYQIPVSCGSCIGRWVLYHSLAHLGSPQMWSQPLFKGIKSLEKWTWEWLEKWPKGKYARKHCLHPWCEKKGFVVRGKMGKKRRWRTKANIYDQRKDTGFPGGSDSKESAWNAGDPGL